MKAVVILFAVVAAVLAESGEFQAAYYPVDPLPIETNSLKVVNGHNAIKGQFPYQISLQRRGIFSYSHICGGSIVGYRWILTAAHCVSGGTASNFQIKAGITLLNDAASSQTVGVQRIIIHSLYPGGSSVSPNDIALLRLNNELVYDALTQPIRLPKQGQITRGDSFLSGWGLTRSGGSIPNNLQWLQVPIMPQDQCRRELDAHIRPPNPFHDELNICSGLHNPGESACNGDSGGPLAQNNEVIGVVSWGLVPCGERNTPSVYAKVSAYVDWIRQNSDGEV